MNTLEIRRVISSGRGLPGLPEAALAVLRCVPGMPEKLHDSLALALSDGALRNRLLLEASASGEVVTDAAPMRIADRLGLPGVRAAVFRHTAMTLFPPDERRRLDRETFWKHGFVCAAFAERIARRLESVYADDAYVAGLLHDIGKPALDLVAPDGYSKAMDLARAQGIFVLEAERRELGVDHTLAGKWLAEFWKLPDPYVAVIWLHHHPQGVLDATQYPVELVDIVALADALTHDHFSGYLDAGNLHAACDERRVRLGLTREDLFHIAGESHERQEGHAPVPPKANCPPAGDPEPSAVEGLRYQRRFLRYRALHEMNARLSPALDRLATLHIVAQALRSAFSIPAGCCLAEGDDGAIDGLRWRNSECIPQPFHIDPEAEGNAGGATDEGIAQVVRELLPERTDQSAAGLHEILFRHGFVAVPISAGGHSIGRIIFDIERSGISSNEEDMTDLLAYATAAGIALMQRRRGHEQETQTEDLATALWKQELQHRQAVRAERLVSVAQLAAGAAHEINNPLAVISGRAQLLLSRASAPEDVKALDTIVQQSRRINKILNDLMQFARPADPQLEPTIVSFTLHQVVAMLRDRLEEKDIKVAEHYAAGLPRTPLDRRQMEQVFLNVILNAEQAMGRGPGLLTLTVKPGRERKSVLIQVTDTGHGIPSAIMDRVFEPFFTTHDAGESTGLGLAVCHGIVENHRGTITLHSTEGEGATCTITLPGIEEHSGLPEQRLGTTILNPSTPARPSVLLADLDEDFRQVLRAALQNRGYAVRLAEDALETIATIMGHPVDVVLLDLRMPPIEGLSLTHDIHNRFPSARIVAIAPPNAGDEIDNALRAGARVCLRKPFDAELLLLELQKILPTQSNVA